MSISNFEAVLSHLGPSAKPLFSFLNYKEARNLLTTNRFVKEFVVNYAARWGGFNPPYFQRTDGSFTLRTKMMTVECPPLEPSEFYFRENDRRHKSNQPKWEVYISIHKVISGTKEEIMAIFEVVKPYMQARKEVRRVAASFAAAAAAEAAAIEEAAAAVAAAAKAKTEYEAKYTIKGGPLPKVNPWKKQT
jgi:hypothetical protein